MASQWNSPLHLAGARIIKVSRLAPPSKSICVSVRRSNSMKDKIMDFRTNAPVLRSLSIGVTLMLAMTLSGNATAQKRNKDQATCATMGASPGSPAYTDCMLQQQRRRDQKMSTFLDQQLMHQELGRPAREKLAEKRARRAREKEQDHYHQ